MTHNPNRARQYDWVLAQWIERDIDDWIERKHIEKEEPNDAGGI